MMPGVTRGTARRLSIRANMIRLQLTRQCRSFFAAADRSPVVSNVAAFEPASRFELRLATFMGMFLCAVVVANLCVITDCHAEPPGRGTVSAPEDEPLGGSRTSGEPVVEVRVEGWETIPPEAILRLIKTQPGRPVEERQVMEDVRSLYKTRWFMHVEPEYQQTKDGLVLVFKLLEKPIVQRVQYLGRKRLKENELAARTGLKVGSPFDVSANREAARRLESYYHEKGFVEATVTLQKGNNRDDREVIFRIHEGAKQRVVWRSFEGNRAFSDELLKIHLVSKSAWFWYLGGKFDPATIDDDIEAIKKYYNMHGYFDADVQQQVTYSDDRSAVYLKYKIEEGVQTKIRKVIVNGNDVISEAAIRKDLEIADGDMFNAWTINKDAAKIKSKYDELGRLYATVNPIPRHIEQSGVCDLVFAIDESQPFTIRNINVHIEGDNPHTKRTVALNYLRIFPGDPASREAIEKSKRQLDGSQAFKAGATRVVIKKVEPDEVPAGSEEIRPVRGQSFDDEPSAPRSEIQGELRSQSPARIRGDLQQQSVKKAVGPQTLSPDLLSRSTWFGPRPDEETKVQEPTIFDGYYPEVADFVEFRGQSVDDPFANPANPMYDANPQGDPYGKIYNTPQPGQIDVDIFPQEERTGRLMFGVGVNSNSGLVGSIVLSEQNFNIMRPPRSWQDIINGQAWRGGGQRFRLEAVPGTVVSRYMASWSDPYFMDTNYNLGVSGFYFNRFYPDWTEEREGGRISVGRQFTPFFSGNVALRLENVHLSNPDKPTPSILTEALGDNFLSTIRFSLVHDTRDSAFLPASGHKVELSYEQAFGEFNYPRFEVDGRQFYTLYSRADGGGRHILSLSGNLGWTGNDTPIFERFYAGGYQTFRGFAFRGVSPREFGVRTGGEWLALGSIEYMIPLVASDMMQAVVFSDFGTVENNVSFSDFRITAGAGLRVTVPAMGPVPLAFDFAFPVASQKFDNEQVFSFYVGGTF